MAKVKYLELISLTILISLICVSTQKYEKSNLKKFLSKLGLPDIPSSYQFLDEIDESNPQNKTDDDTIEEETETDKEEQESYENNTEPEYEESKDSEEEEENKGENEGENEGDKDKKEEEEDDDTQIEEEEEAIEEEEEKEQKTYINVKCLWVQKYNVYSLQKLQNKNKDYEKDFEQGTVIFNFCQNSVNYKENTVVWEKNLTNGTNVTIKTAGSIEGDSKNKNEWDELNDDEDPGLLIKLTHGEKYNNDKYHQTYLKIYCDPDIPDKKFYDNIDLSEFYDKDYKWKHYIKARSIYGCALNDWYLLRRIMKEKKVLFFIGFFAIGLFLCMWGKKFQVPTILITMGLIFCYIVTLIVLNFVPSLINTEQKLWYLLGIGFLIGGVVGYLIKAKMTIFTILLGISMGYSVAEVVYQFIQGFITLNPTYLYYGTVGVCCVAGIGVGFFLVNSVMIIGTSLLGGYIAMRGVSILFGNYMDEGQFADLIKNKEYEQLKHLKSGWTYAYLGLWLVLTVFGVYYQCIGHKKSSKSSSKETDYKKQEK